MFGCDVPVHGARDELQKSPFCRAWLGTTDGTQVDAGLIKVFEIVGDAV